MCWRTMATVEAIVMAYIHSSDGHGCAEVLLHARLVIQHYQGVRPIPLWLLDPGIPMYPNARSFTTTVTPDLKPWHLHLVVMCR
jgi:hypothetical protein